VGLFKSMKDLTKMTQEAKQLQRQQQQEAGYKPGMAGSFEQMGDLVSDATEQLGDLAGQSADAPRILAEGIAGQGVIVGMGTPARGAATFNLDIDLEVHIPGRKPYQVSNQYIVPRTAMLGQGVSLPIKVDPNDPAKIAIDWDSAQKAPAEGQVRPAEEAAGQPARGPHSGFTSTPASGGGGDSVADLERLAKLHKSGALTDAEFAKEKAKILGS
jgi:hypothetical protein